MSIFPGSRYRTASVIAIPPPDGSDKFRAFLSQAEVLSKDLLTENSYNYTTERGDLLDLVAFRASGLSRLWWAVADWNDIDYLFDVKPGDDFVIGPPESLMDFQ